MTIEEDIQDSSRQTRERLAARLKAIRDKRGLTVRQLADICGLSRNHISRLEQGRYNFTIDTLSKVCEALGISILLIESEND